MRLEIANVSEVPQAPQDGSGREQNQDPVTGKKTHLAASQMKRLAISSAPAALISCSLFLMMGGLIAAEFVPAEASEHREIVIITPEEIEPEKITVRPDITPLEVISAPPPAPKVTINKVPVDLNVAPFPGAPPAVNPIRKVVLAESTIVVFGDEDARPLSPPIPVYPSRAIDRGLEGECSVRLDVDVRGRPYNVEADCTDRIFKRAAEKAVRQVQFSPKIKDGVSLERKNIIYPLTFEIGD